MDTTNQAPGVEDQAQEATQDGTDQQPTPQVSEPAEEAKTGDPARNEEDTQAKKLRAEAAKYRTERNDYRSRAEQAEAKVKEVLDNIAKLAGVKEAESPEDLLAKTQAELAARDAELRELRLTGTLGELIEKAGGDRALTLAVMRGTNALTGLDPADNEFSSQAEQLVRATIEAHPCATPAHSAYRPLPRPAPDEAKVKGQKVCLLSVVTPAQGV
ncbi:hypothetical protein J5O04_11185 [Corynebacterium hindlerae]|uniref:hypothetical protein n=1 Tax=Corynebacterium hindlerae TaxID=699041 RepID=UPI001AD7E46B|nr:hypothetical protein [Corynebacterium hindlerae]QTH59350.1 hypothetical protein J5O04_11185 [Corynebacterium hindlerae]